MGPAWAHGRGGEPRCRHADDNPGSPWNGLRVRKLLLHWLSVAASLALVDTLFAGVGFRSLSALAVSAAVLGLVNAIVRPILVLLTWPVTLASLGLFYLVINGLAFGLAAYLVPGFELSGFGTAIAAALLTSVLSTLVAALLGKDD